MTITKAYCVFHDGKEFVTMNYQTFKENQDTSAVHFIGTYTECEEFINRSVAAQELIDSANREHEYELITAEEALKELEKVETYTREEVYLVANRSIHAVINNLFTDNRTQTMKQVIDSEIDTVKLF